MAKILNANIDVTLGGENASNEVISSQKAIKTYVDNKFGNLSYTATCPAITPVEDLATWVVTHNLNSSNVICSLYDSNGAEILKNTTIDSANQVTITFNANIAISAGDYKVVVFAMGSGSGGGGGSASPNAGYTATCPALTLVAGKLTWVVTHNLGTETVIAGLYTSVGIEIMKDITINSANQITVVFNANADASAGDYTIVIVSTKAVITDDTIDSESTNPVQNKVIATALNGRLDVNASNLSSTGQKVFDGQWVTKSWRIYNNESCVNSSGATITDSIDFSSYLPDDEYSYEVYMTYWMATNDPTNVGTSTILSSAFVHNIGVDSSNVATNVYSYISQANKYRIDSTHIIAHASIGSMIVIVNPYPYRKVNFQYYNGANGYVSDLTAVLYRRIGTNS